MLLNKESGKALAGALKKNSMLKELDVSHNYEHYVSSSQDGAAFIQELTVGLSTNGALAKLIMRRNGLFTKEAGKELGDMLMANTTLKELDISDNHSSTPSSVEDILGFLKGFADGVSAIGALVKLDMSCNDFEDAQAGKALGDMLAVNTVLKDLNLSNCWMKVESTKAFAVGLGANGALTSLNISSNHLTGILGSDMSGVKALAAAIPECK